MSRPTPELLNPNNYPFRVEITTRFADLDLQRHINNVAMAALIEDGRCRFHRHINLADLRADGAPVVVANEINYLNEAGYPDPVTVHAGILALGRTSWTLAALVIQNGKPCAFAKTTAVSSKNGAAVEMSEALRAIALANRVAVAE